MLCVCVAGKVLNSGFKQEANTTEKSTPVEQLADVSPGGSTSKSVGSRGDCSVSSNHSTPSKDPDDVIKLGRYECTLCAHWTRSRIAIQMHVMMHLNYQPNSCPVCFVRSTSVARIRTHLRHVHRDKDSVLIDNSDGVMDAKVERRIRFVLGANDDSVVRLPPEVEMGTHAPDSEDDEALGVVTSQDGDERGGSIDKVPTKDSKETQKLLSLLDIMYGFRCRMCDSQDRSYGFIRHHVMEHLNYYPYKCLHCQRSFVCPLKCKSHMFDQHERYEASVAMSVNNELERQVRQNIGYSRSGVSRKGGRAHGFECRQCSFLSGKTSTLNHIREHLSYTPFSCPYCDSVKSGDRSVIFQHIAEDHTNVEKMCRQPEINLIPEMEEKLLQGYKVYEYESDVLNESGTSCSPDMVFHFVCRRCPFKTESYDHMRLHVMAHNKYRPYGCLYCAFEAFDPTSVTNHMRRKHASSKMSKPGALLDKREEQAITREVLRSRRRLEASTHDGGAAAPLAAEDSEHQSISATTAVYRAAEAVDHGESSDSTKLPPEEDFIGTARHASSSSTPPSDSASSGEAHIDVTIIKLTCSFKCKICDRRPGVKGLFYTSVRHHVMEHLNYYPYRCEVCSMCFVCPLKCKSHMFGRHNRYQSSVSMSVNNEMEREVRQNIICSPSYKQRNKYRCNHCPFISNRSSMWRHVREHQTYKPVTSGRSPQVETKPEGSFKIVKSESEIIGESLPGGADDVVFHFVCRKCPFKTESYDNMRLHVMAHTKYRPYACSRCSFTAFDAIAVVNHARHKHPSLNRIVPRKTVKASKEHAIIQEVIRSRRRVVRNAAEGVDCPTRQPPQIELIISRELYLKKSVADPALADPALADHALADHALADSARPEAGVSNSSVAADDTVAGGRLVFRCKICDITSWSYRRMRHHIMGHIQYYPYRCLQCKKGFECPVKCRRHMLVQYNKYESAVAMSVNGEMERQVRQNIVYTSAGKKPFKCYTCKADRSNKRNMEVHVRAHLSYKPYACPYCSCMKSGNPASVTKHIVSKHGEGCGIDPSFKPEPEMEAKVAAGYQAGRSESEIIGESSTGSVDNARFRFSCMKCSFNTESYDYMRLHVIGHSDYKPFRCCDCTFDASDFVEVTNHMRQSHGSRALTRPIEKILKTRERSIEQQVLESRHRLKPPTLNDVKRESQLRKEVTPITPTVSSSIDALLKQSSSTCRLSSVSDAVEDSQLVSLPPEVELHDPAHQATANDQSTAGQTSGQRDGGGSGVDEGCIRCKMCSKYYLSKYSSYTHIRHHVMQHLGYFPYKCPSCEKGFVCPFECKTHLLEHHDMYEASATMAFDSRQERLVRQNIVYVAYDNRQYQCNQCTVRMLTKCGILIHVREHLAYTPFSCPYCSSIQSADRDKIVKHIKNKHNVVGYKKNVKTTTIRAMQKKLYLGYHIIKSERDDFSESEPSTAGDDVFHFVCSKCPFKCESYDYMLIHMMAHAKYMPYGCLSCPYKAYYYAAVVDHMRHDHASDLPIKPGDMRIESMERDIVRQVLQSRCRAEPVAGEDATAGRQSPACDNDDSEPLPAIESAGREAETAESINERAIARPLPTSTNSSSDDAPTIPVTAKRHSGSSWERCVACDLCRYQGSNALQLRHHVMKHFGYTPYTCPVCKHLTTSMWQCTEHMVRSHGSVAKKMHPHFVRNIELESAVRRHLMNLNSHRDVHDLTGGDGEQVEGVDVSSAVEPGEDAVALSGDDSVMSEVPTSELVTRNDKESAETPASKSATNTKQTKSPKRHKGKLERKKIRKEPQAKKRKLEEATSKDQNVKPKRNKPSENKSPPKNTDRCIAKSTPVVDYNSKRYQPVVAIKDCVKTRPTPKRRYRSKAKRKLDNEIEALSLAASADRAVKQEKQEPLKMDPVPIVDLADDVKVRSGSLHSDDEKPVASKKDVEDDDTLDMLKSCDAKADIVADLPKTPEDTFKGSDSSSSANTVPNRQQLPVGPIPERYRHRRYQPVLVLWDCRKHPGASRQQEIWLRAKSADALVDTPTRGSEAGDSVKSNAGKASAAMKSDSLSQDEKPLPPGYTLLHAECLPVNEREESGEKADTHMDMDASIEYPDSLPDLGRPSADTLEDDDISDHHSDNDVDSTWDNDDYGKVENSNRANTARFVDNNPFESCVSRTKTVVVRCIMQPVKLIRKFELSVASPPKLTSRALAGPLTSPRRAERYQCAICKPRMRHRDSLYNIRRHVMAHFNYRPYTCSRCSYSSSCSNTVQTHIRRTHRGDCGGGKPAAVRFMKNRHIEKKVLASTRKVSASTTATIQSSPAATRSLRKLTSPSSSSRQLSELCCSLCGYRAATMLVMTEHLVREIGYQRYQCARCERMYFTADDMRKHISAEHAGASNTEERG